MYAMYTLTNIYIFFEILSFESYLVSNTRSDLNSYFTPEDKDLVQTLITNLSNKTSSGIDNISNKLLKQIIYIIVQPLTLIINQSLTSGITLINLKHLK